MEPFFLIVFDWQAGQVSMSFSSKKRKNLQPFFLINNHFLKALLV